MRVPWFAAFTVAFVNFNAINGVRDEASNTLSEGNTVSVVEQVTHDGVETVGVENQDSVARTSDPNVGVTDDYANAVWWAYPHARPNTKLEIPNAWVLEFVNPKWKYNKQDWKSYKLNWKKQITNADTWRQEIKKDLETDHSKWNDKIWLNNWFREKKLKGPEVVWSKYSNSSWHSQQPLRWADPKYGTAAPMDQQQTYIKHQWTGTDWHGIRDLNNNLPEKVSNLKRNPSELMNTLRRFCDEGVGNNIAKGDFVIKSSHLSESQGVFVTKGGKLVKAIKTDFIEKILFPCRGSCKAGDALHGYSEDANSMQEEIQGRKRAIHQATPTMGLFQAFPKVQSMMTRFTAGTPVCVDDDNETLAFVHLAMEFLEMIWVSWESARSKVIPHGTLIEKIRSYDVEIKVSVGLGFAWGYYYNNIKDSSIRLKEGAKNEAYQIAQDAAVQAGIDFCRVDIIVGTEGLIISEMTLVPGLNYWTKIPLDAHIKKLVAWHNYAKLAEN